MAELHDFYDALLILCRCVDDSEFIRTLACTVEIQTQVKPTHRLVEITDFATPAFTVPSLGALPKIERVEVMLYAATGLYFNKHYNHSTQRGNVFHDSPRDAFIRLCQRVGCYWTQTNSIRERWRLIDFSTPAHLLPLAVHETRPRCKLCGSPVATDAGLWEPVTIIPGSDRQDRQQFGNLKYRTDLHEECGRYVHRILIPARKEQLVKETAHVND